MGFHDSHAGHGEGVHGEKHPEHSDLGEKEDKSHPDDHDTSEAHNHHKNDEETEEELEVTAMLIKFRSPMGMVQLPRRVNENTNMQAALPNYELLKLFSLMGIATTTLSMVAMLVILVSGISVFISL